MHSLISWCTIINMLVGYAVMTRSSRISFKKLMQVLIIEISVNGVRTADVQCEAKNFIPLRFPEIFSQQLRIFRHNVRICGKSQNWQSNELRNANCKKKCRLSSRRPNWEQGVVRLRSSCRGQMVWGWQYSSGVQWQSSGVYGNWSILSKQNINKILIVHGRKFNELDTQWQH